MVLLDALKFLGTRGGLQTPHLFHVAPDRQSLLALRQLYDSGKRPLRSKAGRTRDPHTVRGRRIRRRAMVYGRVLWEWELTAARSVRLPSTIGPPPRPLLQVANLLLLWLASLPEPLFPTELTPELLASMEAGSCAEVLSGVRAVLKQVGPLLMLAFPACLAVQGRAAGPAGGKGYRISWAGLLLLMFHCWVGQHGGASEA